MGASMRGVGPYDSRSAPRSMWRMVYRVCKVFEVESGHMLSKHPDRCRYPHGHTRRIEVVVSANALDSNDMVCDFKALKVAIAEFIDSFDHAMAINSEDPALRAMREIGDRLVVFEGLDPTTEVLAKHIFDFVKDRIGSGRTFTDRSGITYAFPVGLRLERVRVGETSSTWAEYAES